MESVHVQQREADPEERRGPATELWNMLTPRRRPNLAKETEATEAGETRRKV